MAIISSVNIDGGPFDSTAIVGTVNGIPKGDKALNAAALADMFGSIMSDGVCPGDGTSFKVTAGSGLTVRVSPGKAWARGRMCSTDSQMTLDLSAGHSFKVFLRLDTYDGLWSVMVYQDDAGYLPVRSNLIYDMILAEVTVPSGATAVTPSMIIDRRGNSEVCGYAGARTSG